MTEKTRKPLDLEAIAGRVEKATPGPWRYQCEHVLAVGTARRVEYHVYTESGPYGHPAESEYEGDADFIAHARTDIPALVEEVKRLREALREMVNRHESADDEPAHVQRARAALGEPR